MIIRVKPRLVAVAAGSLVAFATLQAQPASAQISWDWGGDSVVGGSGRQVISFSPKYSAGQIVVSFGDRRLYFITRPGEAISYPIAVPREQSRWQGVTSVSQKREHPSWTPTPTMIKENPRLPRWVPGGHPLNPLGVRALYLGNSMYRIHGTDAPWTIGTAVSKGCIRLYNQDVLDLYPRVGVGAKVTVTYQAFTTVASKAPSKGKPSSQSSFFLFGDDEPPAKAQRKRASRSTKARGTTVEANAAASRTAATGNGAAENADAEKSTPVEKGPSNPSTAGASTEQN
jgi:lipoprotein-anchoring transpeptidase ErfK/SrfK